MNILAGVLIGGYLIFSGLVLFCFLVVAIFSKKFD